MSIDMSGTTGRSQMVEVLLFKVIYVNAAGVPILEW